MPNRLLRALRLHAEFVAIQIQTVGSKAVLIAAMPERCDVARFRHIRPQLAFAVLFLEA